MIKNNEDAKDVMKPPGKISRVLRRLKNTNCSRVVFVEKDSIKQ